VKARFTPRPMDTTSDLSLLVADGVAAPDIRVGRPSAQPAAGARSLRETVELAVGKAEAQAIGRALATARGNKSLAARILRTNYTTLHTKMKRFKISALDFRRS
jgi:DNA-binding NtrC family response regulator